MDERHLRSVTPRRFGEWLEEQTARLQLAEIQTEGGYFEMDRARRTGKVNTWSIMGTWHPQDQDARPPVAVTQSGRAILIQFDLTQQDSGRSSERPRSEVRAYCADGIPALAARFHELQAEIEQIWPAGRGLTPHYLTEANIIQNKLTPPSPTLHLPDSIAKASSGSNKPAETRWADVSAIINGPLQEYLTTSVDPATAASGAINTHTGQRVIIVPAGKVSEDELYERLSATIEEQGKILSRALAQHDENSPAGRSQGTIVQDKSQLSGALDTGPATASTSTTILNSGKRIAQRPRGRPKAKGIPPAATDYDLGADSFWTFLTEARKAQQTGKGALSALCNERVRPIPESTVRAWLKRYSN